MEKIMRLAALMREAKTLVEEINKEGNFDVITASIDMNENNVFSDEKQSSIYFFKKMPDIGGTPMRTLIKCTNDKAIYREIVDIDGVRFYRLIEEAQNAKMAV